MPITADCNCGASYTLKDEFGGKSIKCPQCGGSFAVPISTRIAQAEPIFDRDKFLIRQKRVAISSKYFVGDEQGTEIAFVHRPAALGRMLLMMFGIMAGVTVGIIVMAVLAEIAKDAAVVIVPVCLVLLVAGIIGWIWLLAPKRDVGFYRDHAMQQRLMTVRQDFKVSLLNARYTLVDAAGAPLAVLRKNYLYNLVRKRWYIDDPQGVPICVAIEDSILLSLLRRYLGPMFGLLRTNFMIMTPDFETVLGELNRKLTLFDKYVLDLTHDPQRTLDRRVALALGVMLDTGEGR